MKKYWKLWMTMLSFVVLLLVACGNDGDTGTDDDATDDDTTGDVTDTVTGTYSLHIGGYDWGPAVDTVYVDFSETLDEVPTDAITVSETKQVTDWTDDSFPVIEDTFDLEITAAYFVNEENEETTDPTNRVAFEIAVDPNTANPLLYTMTTGRNTWSDPYYLTIALAEVYSLVAMKLPTSRLIKNLQKKSQLLMILKWITLKHQTVPYTITHTIHLKRIRILC